MTTTMRSMPQELIDAIVKLVPDKNTLLACALTDPSFVDVSQRRIFHWMSIQNPAEYERLAGILSQSPHLGRYVRRLALQIHDIPAGSAALALILSTTNRVERLVIQGRSRFAEKNELTSNPSLIAFLSLETLLCVGLVRLGAVPSSIVTTVLQSCEEVCLSQIDIVRDGEGDKFANTPSRSIRHLYILDRTAATVSFLALPRQLDNLASLTHLSILRCDVSSSRHRHDLLAACARTLEILEIALDGPFALPALPSLRHLELCTSADITMTPAALPSSVSVALRATPHLKKLAVVLGERTVAHAFTWGILGRTRAPEWSVLEKRLLEMHTQEGDGNAHGTIPKLVDVHFSLLYGRDNPQRYASFVADVKTQLPRLLEAGFLTFSNRKSFQIPPNLRFSEDYD
ncbi:hypothetical protein C8R45DRAFT_1217312 [Mycena sanguinolenta]|nr:hypothetical protein C8R45DRAFT_1217312 [Mycena sanguinolenta]